MACLGIFQLGLALAPAPFDAGPLGTQLRLLETHVQQHAFGFEWADESDSVESPGHNTVPVVAHALPGVLHFPTTCAET